MKISTKILTASCSYPTTTIDPLTINFKNNLSLQKLYSDFLTLLLKKIVKQILYSKCFTGQNSDLEIGHVNSHEKQKYGPLLQIP